MKRYNMSLTAKGLCKKMNAEEINFDCAVQRTKVWDVDRKSLLIHSMLYGYSIPAFYLTKNEDGTYDSLDGKQRSNAIYEYINNEFMLSASFPVVYDEEGHEHFFAGKTFAELPEWAQDTIKDYSLTAYYYEDINDNEVREFFYRLNNGKPLTSTELTRVKAVSLYKFQTIASHDAIQSILSDKAKANFTNEQMAMQIYAMFYMPNPDFGTKAFRPYITNVNVTDDEVEEINIALDKMLNFFDMVAPDAEGNFETASEKRIYKRVKTRVHFVAMTYLAHLMKDFTQDEFNKTVYDFFDVTGRAATCNEKYNKSCGAGSAKPDAIMARKYAVETIVPKHEEVEVDMEESA